MSADPRLLRLLAGPSPLQKMAMKSQTARVSATRYEFLGQPYCDAPVKVHRSEKPHAGGPGLEMTMWAPCRQCPKCLQFRRHRWAERVVLELEHAPRTWFVTLTFSPIHLAGVKAEAYRQPEHLPQPVREERASYVHVQRYLKRLRKSGGRFCFVAVPEWGDENGRLHYHLLVHEQDAERPLTKRTLQGQWRDSFSQAKLVTLAQTESCARTAGYITKYLTKQSTLVRASLKYGQPTNPVRQTND